MDFGSRRHNVPLWPGSRQGNYQNLSSGEDLPPQDTPDPSVPMSATYKSLLTPKFTPSPNTTGYQDSAANTPAFEELKYDQETPQKSWFGYGWRGGARIAFISTCVTLIINVTLLVFNVLHYPKMGGFPVVYRGTCQEAETRNTIWHLVINVLSTSMLAASNYCMQLLCAPTRSNINRAHSEGVWLDIGVQSLRNLRFVTWKRRGLWLALCISSVPLHLVYNSTFYAAIGSNNYNVLYATPGFITGSEYDAARFPSTPSMNISGFQQNASTWERLSNRDCIQTYAFDFITNYKNVIAVVSNTSDSGSLLDVYIDDMPSAQEFSSRYDSFPWICNDTVQNSPSSNSANELCRQKIAEIESVANTRWNSAGYDISYCLAERILVPDCHLHFAPQLMGPVVLMNIVKCIVTFYVAFRLRDTPLVTLGDAIESFLVQPDPCTRGACLATGHEMAHQFSSATDHRPILRAKTFDGTRYRWHRIISKRQWMLLAALFSLMFVGLILGLVLGTTRLTPATIKNALSISIGTVQAQNLVLGARIGSLGASGVLITALIANAPQALLSFVYMVYNSMFTLMYIGEDWDMYGAYTATTRHKLQIAAKRQTHRFLRVSNPKGVQKSTHFLNLPYRYAIPLIAVSGLLHWFMSQTLYLANISVVDRDNNIPNTDEITTVAYAPVGMIGLLVLAAIMVVVLVANSLRYFGGQMPIVGSNSAAISAACHVEMSERRRRELVLRKIAWGEVPSDGANLSAGPFEQRSSILSVSKGLGINDASFKNDSVYSADDFSDVIDRDEEYGGGGARGTEYSALRGQVEMTDLDDRGAGRSTALAHCTFSDTFVFKPEVGKFYA